MSTVPCAYCQIPVRCRRVVPNEAVYCCSGCAIAHQIPVDAEGHFPINKALLGSLAIAFVFFNQALFALLNGLLTQQGKLDVAARFGWLSVASAAVVWLIGVTLQMSTSGSARLGRDVAVAAGTLAIHALAWWLGKPSLTCMLLANLCLIGWGTRGLWRRKSVGKK